MSLFTRWFGKKASSDPAPSAPRPRAEDGAPAPNTRSITSSASIPHLLQAMASHSGYVRQAAIERAATLGHADFLPALAARLNDWVVPVRDAARAALMTLLPVVPPQAMLAILPAIGKLRGAARHDHAGWLEAFESGLLAQLTPEVLLAEVGGPEPAVARACFQLLQRHAAIDTGDLIAAALASGRDIVVARHAAAMIHLLPPDAQRALHQATQRSPFGAVRAIGLRGLLGGPASDDKLSLAKAHLLDCQCAERGAALAYFSAHRLDARAGYLQVLASGTSPAPVLQVCLTALAGMRQREDAATVREFAAHPAAKVRSAAYAAWLKLDSANKDEIAAMALGDSAPGVKKLAMQIVSRHGAFIPFATACAHLPRPQDWPWLMRLGGNGRWDVIEAVARMAPSANEEILRHLCAKLACWRVAEGGNLRPTAAQVAFLRSDEAGAVFSALAGPDGRADVERELARSLAMRR